MFSLFVEPASYARRAGPLKKHIGQAADTAVIQSAELVSRASTQTLQASRVEISSQGLPSLFGYFFSMLAVIALTCAYTLCLRTQRMATGTQTLLKKAKPFVDSASASLLKKAQPRRNLGTVRIEDRTALSSAQNLASVLATLIASAFDLLRAYVLAAVVGLHYFAAAGVAKLRCGNFLCCVCAVETLVIAPPPPAPIRNLRILVDGEHRAKLEAEEAKRTMLEEQARQREERERINAERYTHGHACRMLHAHNMGHAMSCERVRLLVDQLDICACYVRMHMHGRLILRHDKVGDGQKGSNLWAEEDGRNNPIRGCQDNRNGQVCWRESNLQPANPQYRSTEASTRHYGSRCGGSHSRPHRYRHGQVSYTCFPRVQECAGAPVFAPMCMILSTEVQSNKVRISHSIVCSAAGLMFTGAIAELAIAEKKREALAKQVLIA